MYLSLKEKHIFRPQKSQLPLFHVYFRIYYCDLSLNEDYYLGDGHPEESDLAHLLHVERKVPTACLQIIL
jgi:hypothetical protein